MLKTPRTKQRFLGTQVILLGLFGRVFWVLAVEDVPMRTCLIPFINSLDDSSCEPSIGAISAIIRTSLNPPPSPSSLFHRPFIDGASAVVPQCYMLLCLFVCSMLFNFLFFFILTLLCVQCIYFSNGNWVATCLGKSC